MALLQKDSQPSSGIISQQGDPPLRVLVVHEILPQPDRNGSDVRFLQVLRELIRQGHEVTYVARNGMLRERYAAALEDLGITLYANDVERLRHLGVEAPAEWNFEAVLRSQHFNLAILYLWFWSGTSIPEHYLDEIRRISPTTRIAVLTEDQHGLRERRLAELSGVWSDFERGHDYERRETEICRRADIVLAISDDDRLGFLQRIPDLNVLQVPMIAELAPQGPPFEERSGLLFVGNFDNLANRDGVEWLLANVWPLIRRELPQVSLSLVGHNLPESLANGHEGVKAVGHVADLDPFFAQHRVFVSPVRFGTGIKTKNLAAAIHGVPLVTTTVGAEGMRLQSGVNALIADGPEDFAAATLRAYADRELWRILSDGARQHVGQEFSELRLQKAVVALIQRARSIAPATADPAHVWSYLLVEQRYPDVLRHEPAGYRNLLRFVGYISLAEDFLNRRMPDQALDQLRHLFGTLHGGIPANPLFFYGLGLMGRCYREKGEEVRATRYQESATLRTTVESVDGCVRSPHKHFSDKQIALSVVIPTYNRSTTLRACLAHLAVQSDITAEWEIIIVDDGSTDDTEQICRTFPAVYPIRYFRQKNAGPGAARRLAVEKARGEILLLINDDTMAYCTLFAEHLRVHQSISKKDKIAVLGDFRYPVEAGRRALTAFLNQNPMLFPQVTLDAGLHSKNAFFIACNLSIRREDVLSAGSFDPAFRVAEDTELGIRLRAVGYQVLYHPGAFATHHHLRFTMDDLLRRGNIYGQTQLQLLRKHPHLLGDGTGPFGRLDNPAILAIRQHLIGKRPEVTNAVAALRKFDSIDFTRFSEIRSGSGTLANAVLEMFARAVPEVFWYSILEGFLTGWDRGGEDVRGGSSALSAATP